jgi:hypothetical protein
MRATLGCFTKVVTESCNIGYEQPQCTRSDVTHIHPRPRTTDPRCHAARQRRLPSMPIPNSRLVGGVRSWPGVAVGRPSPYALPGSASVVGLLPSVLGSTSPWTWRRVHAAAYSFTTVSSSSRARPVPARGFLRPINAYPASCTAYIAARQEPKPVGEAAAVAARAAALPAHRRHYARGLRSARQGRTRVRHP